MTKEDKLQTVVAMVDSKIDQIAAGCREDLIELFASGVNVLDRWAMAKADMSAEPAIDNQLDPFEDLLINYGLVAMSRDIQDLLRNHGSWDGGEFIEFDFDSEGGDA
jgi:hypothetical protein